ncbi:30S ribosomal protein S18 [Candidatus Gottesmanbacteria bacterium]|nr:30S ribosomal protein S18 [Candidatus Gottesmanbacteria bacterium]
MVRKTVRRFSRPKPCSFCGEKQEPDYKLLLSSGAGDPASKKTEELRRFVSERGKIISRERTGICRQHQRKLTIAIKRARILALLPFVTKVK